MFSRLLLIIALSFPLFAQSESKEIGVILALSGEAAPFGAVVRRGVEHSRNETSPFVYEDDACQGRQAVSAFLRLRQKGIQYFLGPCCTVSMGAVAPLIRKNNLLAMNVCTGSEKIWNLSGGKVFHAQYSAEQESRFNANWMWKRGMKRVVVLFMEEEYARAHEEAFRASFPGTIVETLSYNGPDSQAMKSLILRLKTLDFDTLYIPTPIPFFMGFLSEAAKQGVDVKQVFGTFTFELPEIFSIEGKKTENVLYSYPEMSSNLPPAEYFAQLGSGLLMDAIEECGFDTQCVTQSLAKSEKFDDHGFLKSNILIKKIVDGHSTIVGE